MNEKLVESIVEYVDYQDTIFYGYTANILDEDEIHDASAARWAAKEGLQLVLDNPDKLPLDVLEEFQIKLTYFQYLTSKPESKNIFFIAAETIGDMLLAIAGEP